MHIYRIVFVVVVLVLVADNGRVLLFVVFRYGVDPTLVRALRQGARVLVDAARGAVVTFELVDGVPSETGSVLCRQRADVALDAGHLVLARELQRRHQLVVTAVRFGRVLLPTRANAPVLVAHPARHVPLHAKLIGWQSLALTAPARCDLTDLRTAQVHRGVCCAWWRRQWQYYKVLYQMGVFGERRERPKK